MSKKDKDSDEKIFDQTTAELVDLNSSQETVEEVQIVGEEQAADKVVDLTNDQNDQGAEGVEEEEAIHRLRPIPSPQKRSVRDSQLNPLIHLDGSHWIPYVRLDRNEILNYEKNRKKDKDKCQAQVDQEAMQTALDRQVQLRVMKRLAEAEKIARARQTSKKGKSGKGKYPKNLRKIVKKSSLSRAERSLPPPMSPMHPDAPRTSTPTKKIVLEELQEGLRQCTQHCQSFYNRNGQPPLDDGTWPAHLSLNQARKAYRRNYQVAERFPSLLGELEHPNAFDTDEDEGIEKEAADEEKDEDDLQIPTAEELIDNIENPTPSTSRGIKARPVAAVFPMDKYGSLIGHGSNLFLQGSNLDANIEAALEKLRRQTALKYALKTSKINATAALLARQGVLEEIEKYKDRIQYMTGHRRRILDILIRQQEMAEEAINSGIEPTLAQLGLTIEEAQEDFNEIQSAQDQAEEEEEVQVLETEPEVVEPEEEGNLSHVSSNPSQPGLCDPQNPCSGDGPCRHMSDE